MNNKCVIRTFDNYPSYYILYIMHLIAKDNLINMGCGITPDNESNQNSSQVPNIRVNRAVVSHNPQTLPFHID